MKDVAYHAYLPMVIENLSGNGLFLVSGQEKANAMTIGWGSIGYYWGKPMFIVPVRQSRFTHSLIDQEGCFTVNVPATGTLKKELLFCGSKSGRNVDKFDALGITRQPGKVLSTPVIKECVLHYECRVVMAQDMQPGKLTAELESTCYPGGDFHTLYYGEIVACYRTDE